MANPFCHLELATDNTGRAKEFYTKLFDWQFEQDRNSPVGPYTGITVGGGTTAAMMPKRMPEQPTAWLAYVLVDSVAGTLEKVRKLGGKVIVDRTPIPEMGAFAVLADPTGAALGVWESSKK
jgi:predicted enzyme related to lactoylglutathione lyase